MNTGKVANDNIKPLVNKLITDVDAKIGSGHASAVRDILTELMHICKDMNINFEERVESSTEVYLEENAS